MRLFGDYVQIISDFDWSGEFLHQWRIFAPLLKLTVYCLLLRNVVY